MGKSSPKFNREIDSQTQTSESLKDSQHTNHHFDIVKIDKNSNPNLLKRGEGGREFERGGKQTSQFMCPLSLIEKNLQAKNRTQDSQNFDAVKINPNKTNNLLERVGGVGEFEGERGATFASLAKSTTHTCTFKPSLPLIKKKQEEKSLANQILESSEDSQTKNQTQDSYKTSKSPQQVKSSTGQISESQKDSLFAESTDSLISIPRGITMPITSQKGQEMEKTSKSTNIQVKSAKAPKLYRPIIASALATALGVSVAVANPTFNLGNNNTDVTNQMNQQVTWTQSGDLLKLNTYKTLAFEFATPNNDLVLTPEGDRMKANVGYQAFKMSSNKGVEVQDMTFNFQNIMANMTATLDLSQATGVAFKGNLSVRDHLAPSENKKYIFTGKFGGDFVGNINFTGTNTTADLTFLNGSKLNGSLIFTQADNAHFKFEGNGGEITGNINMNNGGYSPVLTIDFNGNSGRIGGMVDIDTKGKNGNRTVTINANSLRIEGGFKSADSGNGKGYATFTGTYALNLAGQNNYIGKIQGSNANNALELHNHSTMTITERNGKAFDLTLDGGVLIGNISNASGFVVTAPKSSLTINGGFTGTAASFKHNISIDVKDLNFTGNLFNPSTGDGDFNITLNGGISNIGGDILAKGNDGKGDTHNTSKANFALKNDASINLKGASNTIGTFTATGNNNALTIANGATTNSISTLTLGAKAIPEKPAEGNKASIPAKDGTLTLSTANALTIDNLNVAHQNGALNIAQSSKGAVTIGTATLDGKTLTIDNTDAQALTITTLTTSGTNTINLKAGATTINSAISGINNFTLDSKTNLTLGAGGSTITSLIALGNDANSTNTLTIASGASGTNTITTLHLGGNQPNTKGFLAIENNSSSILTIGTFTSAKMDNILEVTKGAVEITNELAKTANANFRLNGASLTLNGANNYFALGVSGTSNNLVLAKGGNTISTLTLGTTTGAATDSTLNLSTANALTIDSLNVTHQNGTLNIDSTSKGAVTIGTATLDGKTLTISNVGANAVSPRSNFNLLTINKISADSNSSLTFETYVNPNADQATATLGGEVSKADGSSTYGYAYSDRVIIKNRDNISESPKGTYQMKIFGEKDTLKYTEGKGTETKGNIAVATIAKKENVTSGTPLDQQGIIKLEAIGSAKGFRVVEAKDVKFATVETDEYGKVSAQGGGGYITYFVRDIQDQSNNAVKVLMPSLTLSSVELFLANFNSLNKRMGDLRDNPYSQGVWARVFNGLQNNKLFDGINSSTNYTSIQAGYDHGTDLNGKAKNYLGFAFSFSFSSSDFKGQLYHQADGGAVIGNSKISIENFDSKLFEVAFYNAYIADQGWYNDTIAKFSYILNDLNIGVAGENGKSKINTYALMLSNELGYRFKVGSNQEWFIDPQIEVGAGYIKGNSLDITNRLNGSSLLAFNFDALWNVRGRVGTSFGYDFKNFSQKQDVDAKLYLGVFGEFDYFKGGTTSFKTKPRTPAEQGKNIPDFDARVVLNAGTNITIKEATRIYFDFETSFVGKITTDYKINAGVRYAFGEKRQLLEGNKAVEEKKDINQTPLKLEEKKEAKQTQEVSEAQKVEENQTPKTKKKAKAKKPTKKKVAKKQTKKVAKKQSTKKAQAKGAKAKKPAQTKKAKAQSNAKTKQAKNSAQSGDKKDNWGWW